MNAGIGNRRTWCLVLGLAGLLPGVAAQKAPPREIPLTAALVRVHAEDLRKTVEYLAADALQGRCAGEEGCAQAGDMLADRFEELGLTPAGDEGTFLQHFELPARGGGTVATANVVGFWEGSDPLLKDQVVVLGAHYDHVGNSSSPDVGRMGGTSSDRIWNGADDNASGTSAVLEIATAITGADLRVRRSLLFIAFSAEEHGLLGSLYYCEHPFVPLEKTAAMINLDMIGRNPDQPVEILGLGSLKNQLWYRFLEEARSAEPDLELKLSAYSRLDSDHYSFQMRQIPVAFFFTGLHRDYHRPGDHADLLSYEHMEQITRLTLALLSQVACSDAPLEFDPPQFGQRKSLGVSGRELTSREMKALGGEEGQGGFLVEEVLPDSVAAAADILPGDVLLAVRDRELSVANPEASLRRAVATAPEGEDVDVRVLRDGETLTLAVRW